MLTVFDPTGTVTGFQSKLYELLQEPTIKGVLILACDANNFTPDELDEILRGASVPLFGGIFPEIIFGSEKFTQGTAMMGLTVAPNVQVIADLSDMSINYDEAIDEKFPTIGTEQTMFVFVDGLAKRISALIDGLFNVFGLQLNYVGGGAGSLSFQQKPCLFTNQGLLQDSAVLVLADLASGVGVSHGWQTISGPFQVTESDRNVIKSLNWQPAFDVYRQVVEAASGKVFTADNFFELAKGYPFGINKIGGEKIVRDPITRGDAGALVCVGEVPSGCYVDILSGQPTALIAAATHALQLGQTALATPLTESTTLLIDCISRVLFLEEQFSEEVKAVFDGIHPLVGALTLGEIANSGRDYLEFYNKTVVVGVLEG